MRLLHMPGIPNWLRCIWICPSNSFTKAEKLLSLDCNRDPFYVFIKTSSKLKAGNQQLQQSEL